MEPVNKKMRIEELDRNDSSIGNAVKETQVSEEDMIQLLKELMELRSRTAEINDHLDGIIEKNREIIKKQKYY